jgi:murein DD-endopeptidase MepM/ murein hydrolase activator NlpD
MDRKIHIHFFPHDSSRVRLIAFSRPLGLGLLFTALPLCLLGFWLVLSGTLHESPARHLERQRLEREDRALHDKAALLQHDADALKGNLDTLESARIRAVQATGLETPEAHPSETHTMLFPFFRSGSAEHKVTTEDLNQDLKQAQGASFFFDSSLFVLSRNRALVEHFPTAYPVGPGALVIRPFGFNSDPFTGRRSMHNGVDFSQTLGAPVYASGSGTIIGAGQDPIWGYFVRIRHTDRVETYYAHLQQIRVSPGENVVRGQVIGWIGQSGSATGPHLHFEMLFMGEHVDPLKYLLPAENQLADGSVP